MDSVAFSYKYKLLFNQYTERRWVLLNNPRLTAFSVAKKSKEKNEDEEARSAERLLNFIWMLIKWIDAELFDNKLILWGQKSHINGLRYMASWIHMSCAHFFIRQNRDELPKIKVHFWILFLKKVRNLFSKFHKWKLMAATPNYLLYSTSSLARPSSFYLSRFHRNVVNALCKYLIFI